MSTEAELNERLAPIGYKAEGDLGIARLDGTSWHKSFRNAESLEAYVAALEESTWWGLSLRSDSSVTVDRSTGTVEPNDGSAPFNVRDASGWSGSITSREHWLNDADEISLRTASKSERPALGGPWYKLL